MSSCFSGSDDLSAKLWDVRTGQCIYGIQTHTCAAVKFDEQKLVTGSFDNTIASWEWSTGAKIQQFRGHTGAGWSKLSAILCLGLFSIPSRTLILYKLSVWGKGTMPHREAMIMCVQRQEILTCIIHKQDV